MTAQRRFDFAPQSKALHPDTRLCLAMVSAGLSALAALGPEARAAIAGSLDETLSSGLVSEGEGADFVHRLREQIGGAQDPAAEFARELEAALVGQALLLPDHEDDLTGTDLAFIRLA